MASKGKKTAKSPTGPSPTVNKIVGRILLLVVLLGGVYEFLQTLNKEVAKIKVLQVFKVDGQIKGAGPFVPWGAVAVDDKIVVADNQNNRILLFNRKGEFLKSWGTVGNKKDQFHEPSGMTSDDKGNVYVMDAWNSAIKGFDLKGKQTAFIDLTNMGFFGPRGLTFDGTNFAIADTGSHRVVLVGPKGNVITAWGSHGEGDNQFQGPLAVVSDKKGTYYVADTDNNRIQWLDANGKKIRSTKLNGGAMAVAVDQAGRVYASTKADAGQTRVFDAKGKVLGILIDQSGSEEPFKDAKFLSITPDNLLLVTSGGAVYLYQLPNFDQK